MSSTQRIVVAPGHYIIRDTQNGKVSYWQREYHQSAADRHGTSTADYIHAMYFFLMQAKAKSVLMIGCGGGTLATMLHRAGVESTVVDLHQMSFDIAHRYFHMPQEITCHTADGIAWMKAHRGLLTPSCWTLSANTACRRPSCSPVSSSWPNRA